MCSMCLREWILRTEKGVFSSGVSNLQLARQIGFHLFLEMKFYWNAATPHLCISR